MEKSEKINILIADDEAESCQFMQRGLSIEGINVDVAFDGREALNRIEANRYDFIFLDFDMPQLTGVELANIVRQKGLDSVVVMMTGYSVMDDLFSKVLGVDEYLQKPFLLENIKSIILKYKEKGRA